MKEILDQLNPVQRQAVLETEGPVMVIAGAGSGKTRVLTYRVAYLLQKGVDPFNVLALTFTNKAAREMRERIVTLVGGREAANVAMGTFHSIFARVLRVEGHRMGFPNNFTIYDTDDSKRLIKQIVQEKGLDPKLYAPNIVLGRISSAKSNLISAAEYNNNAEFTGNDRQFNRPEIGNLYTAYQMRLLKAQSMDFDDILFYMSILLRDFPEVLIKYQHRYKYIMVDEYQDTNHAQYWIIKKLAANNENICVVGDDAQSIYAFRGANIHNILNFKRDYPDYKLIKLEQNYRSTQIIVNAANSIISKNKEQIHKNVWTSNEDGEKIVVLRAPTDNEEGMMVARSIFELKMSFQLPAKDFAILYRTNAQSRALEEALRKLNIPYRIYGGLSFYRRKEIKDILAYFRLVINNYDEDALRRCINYPARGIGDSSIEKAIVKASELGVPLWEVISSPVAAGLDIRSNIATTMMNFAYMIKSYSVQLGKADAYELARQITNSSGIQRDLQEDQTPEGVSRLENIEELLNAIKDFTEREVPLTGIETEGEKQRTLDVFLQDIVLLTDADEDEDDKEADKVTMMTIHAAKGLEFPMVYIVGLEENLFPNIQALNSRAELEEERRLFYVALTRAEKRAFLTFAETRYRHGTPSFSEQSRFISEIDENYLEIPHQRKRFANPHGFDSPELKSTTRQLSNFVYKEKPAPKRLERKVAPTPPPPKQDAFQGGTEVDYLQLIEGMNVIHERFGFGVILKIEGAGPNMKATVDFENHGHKQLLLKFAKLKIRQ